MPMTQAPYPSEPRPAPAPRTSRSDRALRIWHMLMGAARCWQTFTYQHVADITGGVPIGLGSVLELIMRYCEDKGMPPLTVLVVQSGSGKPGVGLLTSRDADADRERVYEFEWSKRPVPTAADFAKFE
jgi:hypothetical protein